MGTSGTDLIAAVPHSLLVGLDGDVQNSNVVDLTHDSRMVGPGWAFACVPGEYHDGHDFAPGAVAAGSTLLVVERRLPLDVAQLVVGDVRRTMGSLAAVVHGRPSDQLRIVGVTGTNGKTTVTHLLGAILEAAGSDHRELGTLSGTRTTPEAPDLQRQLREFVDEGVDTVVMEVSSHALALHRVRGVHFDVAVFTNLGHDHLDLHGSLEAYFRAKAQLFTTELTDVGVTNVDDPYGCLLLDGAGIDMVGYRLADAADLAVGLGTHSFSWRGAEFRVPLGGEFNASNVIGALTAAAQLGIAPDVAAMGLAGMSTVPGRYEVVTDPGASVSVVVDYAHTPDGLVELLGAVRTGTAGGRVICVFGCGGDRDREKRPLMGAAAAEHADLVVVTSDNPRNEDPMAIIEEAVAGIEERYRGRLTIDVDRRAGIRAALHMAQPGDVVVIAGKGHEATQTIGDTAHPFDDRAVARELLADMHHTLPSDSTHSGRSTANGGVA